MYIFRDIFLKKCNLMQQKNSVIIFLCSQRFAVIIKLQRFGDFGGKLILSYNSKTETDMQNPSVPLKRS